MLAIILLGTLIGQPTLPLRAVTVPPAATSRPAAHSRTDARSISAAILGSLTPAQFETLRTRGRLILSRDQANDAQSRLLDELALALRPGASASALPAASVRLVNGADGMPALTLSVRGVGNDDLLAVRRLPAIACRW
jgi:hypothetical protein